MDWGEEGPNRLKRCPNPSPPTQLVRQRLIAQMLANDLTGGPCGSIWCSRGLDKWSWGDDSLVTDTCSPLAIDHALA